MPTAKATRIKTRKVATPTITFDQWAESGGTGGIFAKGVKAGNIRIIRKELGINPFKDPSWGRE